MNSFTEKVRSRLVLLGLLLLGLATRSEAQSSVDLFWEGAQAQSLSFAVDSDTHFEVIGQPFTPFVLAASIPRGQWFSPVGLIELDLSHSSFLVMVDGFDPLHPRFHQGYLDGAGARSFNFRPFPLGVAVGTSLHLQGVMLDLARPAGLAVSNLVAATAASPPPVISSLSTHISGPGASFIIQGSNLGGIAGVPTVHLGEVPLTVLAQSEDFVQVTLPVDVVSGHVQVTTPGGSSSVVNNDPLTFVMITGAGASEADVAGQILMTSTTVSALIGSPAEVDVYRMQLSAGEELLVDAFPFDPASFTLSTYDPLLYQTQADPVVQLFLPGSQGSAILVDDNSNPGFGAAIGGLGPRFIVPQSGIYEIKLSSSFSLSTGPYVVNIHRRTPPVQPLPEVLALVPNNAGPGSVLSLVASGLDLQQVANNRVYFRGPSDSLIVAVPTLDGNGGLRVQVPNGVLTGPVIVENPLGERSVVDGDALGQHLFVWGNSVVEDGTNALQPINAGDTVYGHISQPFEIDAFTFSATAGQRVSLRAYPYDFASGSILAGQAFGGVLDPEILISAQGSPAILAADTHSGPGIAAEFGGPTRGAFVAPFTGTYVITVRPWLLVSLGDYLLDLRID